MDTQHYRISGEILFWLGVLVCTGSVIFLVMVHRGIEIKSDRIPLHDSAYILFTGIGFLKHLLPLAAGLLLLASGWMIRREIPDLEAGISRLVDQIDSEKRN